MGGLTRSDDQAAALRMIQPGPAGFIERLPEPDGLPDWITADEIDHYVAEFTRTGFTGGLNWYRNLDRNWEIMADPPSATIDVPAMFIGGTADPVLSFMRSRPRNRGGDRPLPRGADRRRRALAAAGASG